MKFLSTQRSDLNEANRAKLIHKLGNSIRLLDSDIGLCLNMEVRPKLVIAMCRAIEMYARLSRMPMGPPKELEQSTDVESTARLIEEEVNREAEQILRANGAVIIPIQQNGD